MMCRAGLVCVVMMVKYTMISRIVIFTEQLSMSTTFKNQPAFVCKLKKCMNHMMVFICRRSKHGDEDNKRSNEHGSQDTWKLTFWHWSPRIWPMNLQLLSWLSTLPLIWSCVLVRFPQFFLRINCWVRLPHSLLCARNSGIAPLKTACAAFLGGRSLP